MVTQNQQFNGLPMPVFAAFGWAGEDTAIKYALEQLQLFMQALHSRLPRDLHSLLPFNGVDYDSQSVYMAGNETLEEDYVIAFYARPMTFQMMMTLAAGPLLAKALKNISKELPEWHELLSGLGEEWTLRVQQMEVNPETGERAHSKDLYKGAVTELSQEAAGELIDRAAYLNGEDGWVTPIHISYRLSSERASAMGVSLVEVVLDRLRELSPVVARMSGIKRRKPTKLPTSAPRVELEVESEEPAQPIQPVTQAVDEFTYEAELLPLHIRRGFVNLTSQHWPFFAQNARMTVRPIIIHYEDQEDDKSAVWRLVPSDQARIVLGESVQDWLESNFEANDRILVHGQKLPNDAIQVTLSPA